MIVWLERIDMPRRLPSRLAAPLLAAAVALAGCATPPTDAAALADFHANNDPLEPTNRVFYAVNNELDTLILAPLARGYRFILPQPVRTGVHNVLTNLGNPVVLVNDAMQGKPRLGGNTFMRFAINSTIGVLGVFDVARDLGYPAHDNGFGTTLALWGVSGGPYLYLPVLGPSNPRDFTGFGADIVLDPLTYPSGGGWAYFDYSRVGASALDARSAHLDDIEQIKANALDPYATFRSLYQQNRESDIQQARQDLPRTIPAWFAQPSAK
jgi:phospholipid-binding lipoprotein MlaA